MFFLFVVKNNFEGVFRNIVGKLCKSIREVLFVFLCMFGSLCVLLFLILLLHRSFVSFLLFSLSYFYFVSVFQCFSVSFFYCSIVPWFHSLMASSFHGSMVSSFRRFVFFVVSLLHYFVILSFLRSVAPLSCFCYDLSLYNLLGVSVG